MDGAILDSQKRQLFQPNNKRSFKVKESDYKYSILSGEGDCLIGTKIAINLI